MTPSGTGVSDPPYILLLAAVVSRAMASERDEEMPPFLRYGIFTVGVYGVAVTALAGLSSVPVEGSTLLAFTVGFLVFMTVYFASMWACWLFL